MMIGVEVVSRNEQVDVKGIDMYEWVTKSSVITRVRIDW